MPSAAILVPLLLLTASAPAQAAFNPTHAYEDTFEFSGFDGNATLISGQADVKAHAIDPSLALVQVQQFSLTGLDRVCWRDQGLRCEEGELEIQASPGAAVGLHTPGAVDARLTAAHALMMFDDFRDERFQGFDLGPSLLATVVDGQLTLELPPVPKTRVLGDENAGVLALDDQTTLTLLRQGQEIARIDRPQEPFLYTGTPMMEPIAVGAAVLPFLEGDATVSPATQEAAAAGLDLESVFAVLERVTGQRAEALFDLAPFAGVLAGAVLKVPSAGGAEDILLVRFAGLVLTGGASVHAQADAPLVMEAGQIRGASELVGVGYVALPLWSIALWLLAFGVLAGRFFAQAPKTSKRWDRYRWVGLVLTPVALVVVFLLWDREVHAMLGISILHPGQTPLAYIVLAQMGFLSLVLFAAAAPLRMLLRNGLMLARQGTFMNLAAPVATILGFFLGVTLLPAYLEFLLHRVLEQAA